MELVFDGLSHSFGSLAVLDDIRLQVASGEIVVVLGPSGCGKSTLLRLAGGLEVPTAGSVRSGAARGGVRFVFQDPTLLPWRTAAGNVALGLEHRGIGRAERGRRVAQALARVNMAEFAGHTPRTLSGGMRQRIGIARALATDPAVLLMDEPLAALDAQTRDLLIGDLCRLWEESRFTCLYVTHSPAEAVRLAHRVVVLTPRPARIREIVRIDLPLDQRSDAHPLVRAARERIWSLVRSVPQDTTPGPAHV